MSEQNVRPHADSRWLADREERQNAHHRPEEATALESFTLGVQEVVASIEVVADEVDEGNEWNERLHQAEHAH